MADKQKTVRSGKGEGLVWLSAMGIALGMIMIIFMLGLILTKGLEVFWPRQVVLVDLADDAPPEASIRGATSFAAVLVEERLKMGREIDEAGNLQPPVEERQFFIGNRELHGASFKWVEQSHIASMSPLPEAIRVERLEFGDMIAIPVALRDDKGMDIPADADAFHQALAKAHGEVADRSRAIKALEKGRIGRINHEMEAIRLALRAIGRRADAPEPADASRQAELLSRQQELQLQFDELALQLHDLRARQHAYSLLYSLPSGTSHEISIGEVVHYYFPNQLSLPQKVAHFIVALWRFITEDPREANTEGGIWPAIFGTFVMTVLMSAMVTPFGVMAAIYLREYARQGLLVRLVRIAINNLAGVPSIVFGVFGLGFFVWGMGGQIDQWLFSDKLPTATFGTGGIMWASLTLALLTVPVVIVASEEALASVPRGAREGALACGASRWQMIRRVVLPAAAPGILTGVILAMARGAGEVAPLMLVGVMKVAPALPINATFPYVHLDQKFMHLGFHIYDLGFQSPDSEAAKPMVFATTLLLITLVVVLNLAAIIIRERLRRKYATSAF